MIDKLNKIIELTQKDGVNSKEKIKEIAEEMKKELEHNTNTR